MTKTRLASDDTAVSAVIGVILMVAVTVVIAAVAAPQLLSGTDEEEIPEASFEWDYEISTGQLTITHAGGDPVAVDQLYLRGSGFDGSGTDSNSLDGAGSFERALSDDMTTGEFVTTKVTSDYELRVVYITESGEESDTLSENVGPDA